MNKQREIDLKIILENLLIQWKPMLIVGIIASLLVAFSLQFRSQMESQETDNNITLSDSETAAVDEAVKINDEIADYQEYLNDSLVMSVDPYHEKTVIINYVVSSESEPVNAVLNSYSILGETETLAEDIEEAQGIELDNQQILDLISFEVSISSDSTNGGLNITAILTDDMDEETMLNCVRNYIESDLKNTVDSNDEYSLTYIGSKVITRYDETLANQKQDIENKISSSETELNTVLSDFSDTQTRYYNQLVGENSNEETIIRDNSEVNVKSIIKNGIVGFVLGIFLYSLMMLLKEMMRGSIVSTSELNETYEVRDFGTFYEKEYQKGLDAFVHSQKMYNFIHKTNTVDKQEFECKIEKEISNYVTLQGLSSVKRIVITSDSDIDNDITIQNDLDKMGLVFEINIGVSKMRDFEKYLYRAKEFNIPVLGVYGIDR